MTRLSIEAKALPNATAQRLAISPRVYTKIIKITHTIADIEKSSIILPSHFSEAVQYRPQSSLL